MFPGIVISIGGLEPEMKYTISLEFNPVDNARYKYINTKWVKYFIVTIMIIVTSLFCFIKR